MRWLILVQLLLLGIVLYVVWRNRAMKKRQDALVQDLEGKRYWRINMAREPFFKRWLRLMPFEAKGVLIDDGAQLRLRGFWLKGAKAFDVSVPKSDCQVEWLGNSTLRSGNLYWAKLTTMRWTLLFSADTGMYALPSREALADIFRSVFPQIPLDSSKTKDFALEKNPRSLTAAVVFLALLLFALIDSFVFNHFELIEAQMGSMLGKTIVVALIMAGVALLAVLLYRWLSKGHVPARESMVLTLMLTMSVVAALLPAAKRVDQLLASQPAQLYAYRMTTPGNLEPVDTKAQLPKLKFPRMQEYWAQFPAAQEHQIPLLRGPLGLWQLDHSVFDPPIIAFYKKQ